MHYKDKCTSVYYPISFNLHIVSNEVWWGKCLSAFLGFLQIWIAMLMKRAKLTAIETQVFSEIIGHDMGSGVESLDTLCPRNVAFTWIIKQGYSPAAGCLQKDCQNRSTSPGWTQSLEPFEKFLRTWWDGGWCHPEIFGRIHEAIISTTPLSNWLISRISNNLWDFSWIVDNSKTNASTVLMSRSWKILYLP